jgi:hypothetical protein
MTPFISALVNPLNMIILGASFAAGLLSAWWLFPIGFILWIMMLIFASNDPALKLNTTIEERAPVAYRFQRSFDRIQKTEVKLFNTLNGVSGEVQSELQPARETLKDAIEFIHRVTLSMSGMDNQLSYLKSNTDYEAEVFKLQDKIEKATDETIKNEYTESLHTLQKQIAYNQHSTTLLDRYETQLSTIASTLEGAATSILRIKTLPIEKIREDIKQIIAIIASSQNDIKDFEEASQKLNFSKD